MKQVLNTLIDILISLQELSKPLARRAEVVQDLYSIVLHSDDNVRAKPALLALTILISRGVVTPKSMLEIYQPQSLDSSDSEDSTKIENFLARVFAWANRSDVAGSAGRFVAVFFQNKHILHDDVDAQCPLWIKPLIDVISAYPDFLGAVKAHLMPGLFKMDAWQFWVFLEQFQIQDRLGLMVKNGISEIRGDRNLKRKFSMTSGQANVVLCAALQVGKEQGLIEICGKSNS